MFIKPRPYQQDIINKTLETTKSTLIQLPTGGGKTIISKEIAIGLINKFNKKILFIAPKIVLMEQTLETFKALKPQKVHGSNNKFDNDHHILISTLQTASRRNTLNPDVIIIDEVHFGYEKKMLNKIMEYNPNARIIGLSATPFDENGYPFKGFDVIINDYDLVYMIKNKYLVPLRSFILVKPDLSNVDIIAGDYEINQLSEAVSKNAVIMEIVATSKPYIEKSIKTIVFAVDINHAELLKTAFQNEGFTTEALHSKSEEDDNEVIEKFKRGYIKVLVSVLKLTTGFDVPETDLAIIARPTKSQNLYKQMVGRVLRTVDFEKTGIDKRFAILLDCGNVIENLRKPLEPIIPKNELEKKIQKLKCKNCESENVKLKKSSSNLFWECQDCGHKKELENKNHYKCKNCDKKYSYQDGEFELINNKLYLNCECGYETEISIATGDEEFREVDSGIDIEIDNNSDKYFEYNKAKEFIHNLNFHSLVQWEIYNRSKDYPSFLPKNPALIYFKEGWKNINDWLNIKSIEISSNSFENTKEFVKKLDLKSKEEWFDYTSGYLNSKYIEERILNNDYKNVIPLKYDFLPKNLEKNPHLVFDEWKNWNDFLGISKTNYLTYNEASDFVHKLNLKSKQEWTNYSLGYLRENFIKEIITNNTKLKDIEAKFEKIPENIPLEPDKFYKDKGWISWRHWLKKIKIQNNEYINILENRIYTKEFLLNNINNFECAAIIEKNGICIFEKNNTSNSFYETVKFDFDKNESLITNINKVILNIFSQFNKETLFFSSKGYINEILKEDLKIRNYIKITTTSYKNFFMEELLENDYFYFAMDFFEHKDFFYENEYRNNNELNKLVDSFFYSYDDKLLIFNEINNLKEDINNNLKTKNINDLNYEEIDKKILNVLQNNDIEYINKFLLNNKYLRDDIKVIIFFNNYEDENIKKEIQNKILELSDEFISKIIFEKRIYEMVDFLNFNFKVIQKNKFEWLMGFVLCKSNYIYKIKEIIAKKTHSKKIFRILSEEYNEPKILNALIENFYLDSENLSRIVNSVIDYNYEIVAHNILKRTDINNETIKKIVNYFNKSSMISIIKKTNYDDNNVNQWIIEEYNLPDIKAFNLDSFSFEQKLDFVIEAKYDMYPTDLIKRLCYETNEDILIELVADKYNTLQLRFLILIYLLNFTNSITPLKNKHKLIN